MTYQHTLILGGIFLILKLLLFFMDGILLLLFLVFNILLVCNVRLGFLIRIREKHYYMSRYLMALGGVEYFSLFVGFITSLIVFYKADEATADKIGCWFTYGYFGLIVMSVLVQSIVLFCKRNLQNKLPL